MSNKKKSKELSGEYFCQNLSPGTGNFYEPHYMLPEFPVIFHCDRIGKSPGADEFVRLHWHENIEILYFTDGCATIFANAESYAAKAGDIVVINSNFIHAINAASERVCYYCLIPDAGFCRSLGLDVSERYITPLMQSAALAEIFMGIIALDRDKPEYYQTEMCAQVLKLVSHLLRDFSSADAVGHIVRRGTRSDTAKKAIEFMKAHFSENISAEDIAAHLGFTKCYFCHTFRDATGFTAINILNIIRCENAKKLLLSGSEYNISQIANMCGFANASYFTRTYKRIMGCLPSETRA